MSDLHVQVQSVVEVAAPEEMGEAQADVEGVELFVSQREQPENVHKVLVPPTLFIYIHNKMLGLSFQPQGLYFRALRVCNLGP